MTVSSLRHALPASRLRQRLLWASLLMLAAIWPVVAVGQDGPEAAPDDGGTSNPLFSDAFSGRTGEALGVIVRGGVETEAYNHEDAITPLELMTYGFIDDAMIFGDFRGFRSTEDEYGANLGGGYRQYFSPIDRIFGFNAYFDYDETTSQVFRQWGFGIETLGKNWDARANAYFPTGEKTRLLSEEIDDGSQRFVGNQILFDIRQVFGEALTGFDTEIGMPLPGAMLQRHDVRLFAGAYGFSGDSQDQFIGWKGRLQGNIIPSIAVAVEVTSDDVFDTNVVFNASWSFGGFRGRDGEPSSVFSRMTNPVKRNYTPTVARSTSFIEDLVAVDPVTLNPYFVAHVASFAPGPGTGTVEDPYRDLPEESAERVQKPDIIFVHANSVYDGGAASQIVVEQQIRYLGEGDGINHIVDVPGFSGGLLLPRATTNTDRPLFLNTPGNGIELAGDSVPPNVLRSQPLTEVGGFVFGDITDTTSGPDNNGIFGDNIGNVRVRQVDINTAGGDGILLTNATGNIDLIGNSILNPEGVGLRVIGGTGLIRFLDVSETSGAATITKNDGDTDFLLEVRDTLDDGTSSVQLLQGTGRRADLIGDGSSGVLISNNNGNVSIGDTNIANSPTHAIEITGGTGDVTLFGDSTLSGAAGNSLFIHDRLVDTDVLVTGISTSDLTINNRGNSAIRLLNNAGDVQFRLDTVRIDGVQGGNLEPAIDYQGSSGDVTFGPSRTDGTLGTAVGSLLVLNSGGSDAIHLGQVGPVDNTGSFRVNTATTQLTNFGTGIEIVDDPSLIVFNGNLFMDGRGDRGISIVDAGADIEFNGNTFVNNSGGSVFSGILITGNATGVDVSFNDTQINDVAGVAIDGGSGLTLLANPGEVSFTSLNVNGAGGTGIFARNAGVLGVPGTPPTGGLLIGDGVLNITGETAIDVEDSVVALQFTEVTSTGGLFGINLQDNQARTGNTTLTVTGDPGVPGTGGDLSGHAVSSVFLRNTEGVSLSGMTLSNSLVGIDAITDAVNFEFGEITEMTIASIDVEDTPFLSVTDSTLDSGATVGSPEIRVIASNTLIDVNDLDDDGDITEDRPDVDDIDNDGNFTENLPYIVNIQDNIITEQGGSAIQFLTNAGASGTELNFSLISNNIAVQSALGNGLLVNWAGPIFGEIDDNAVTLTGGNSTAFNITSAGSAAVASLDLDIISNTITGFVGNNTGIFIETFGSSRLGIGQFGGDPGDGNTITFTDTANVLAQSQGMVFRLAANSDTVIVNNVINISDSSVLAGDMEGIVFERIAEDANVSIAGNEINLSAVASINAERGISFESGTGTINLFQGGVFSSEDNNIVNINNGFFSPTFFFAPAGLTFNGQILVNNFLFP